jgi:hypothetical protein
MMPPISGMQAIAAATFEGKPVDVDVALGSGPGLGGDGGGWFGSVGSGMIYVHKVANRLSSIFLVRFLFRFRPRPGPNIMPS